MDLGRDAEFDSCVLSHIEKTKRALMSQGRKHTGFYEDGDEEDCTAFFVDDAGGDSDGDEEEEEEEEEEEGEGDDDEADEEEEEEEGDDDEADVMTDDGGAAAGASSGASTDSEAEAEPDEPSPRGARAILERVEAAKAGDTRWFEQQLAPVLERLAPLRSLSRVHYVSELRVAGRSAPRSDVSGERAGAVLTGWQREGEGQSYRFHMNPGEEHDVFTRVLAMVFFCRPEWEAYRSTEAETLAQWYAIHLDVVNAYVKRMRDK